MKKANLVPRDCLVPLIAKRCAGDEVEKRQCPDVKKFRLPAIFLSSIIVS